MDGWTPTIGDPTIYGWVTVFAYGVAALLCWKARPTGNHSEERAWAALSLLLAALAINKQLDLQTLLTDVGRTTAKAHGWYRDRRIVQAAFIAALIAAAVVGVIYLFRTYRDACLALRGALAGTVVLFAFVLVRASSFYKVDLLINSSLAGVRTNHVMELGGIVVVAGCALVRSYASRGSPQQEG